MSFLVKTEEIPAKFWGEEALRNLGSSLGVVRRVDPTKGRIKISVKTDVPLRFNKNDQLPTGAVAKVKLFYENLLRWCSYSGRICLELDLCPLINVNQRAALAAKEEQKNPWYLTRDDGRNQYLSLPHDSSIATHNGHGRKNLPLSVGPLSTRLNPPVGDTRTKKDRFTSNNRIHHQQYPSARASKHHRSFAAAFLKHPSSPDDPKGNGTDDGRKRRHEDSFSHKKSYEPSSKGCKGPSRNDPAPTHLPSNSFCGKQP
ncbi:hypothetical protein ISN44_As12g031630 [Arabidopsis suecica]|uniref:Uncharacterized protein n=1 Tax=Arabidopsis suecica TaxID=45249 RepID=A0A8T1YPM1_ARASU|nr:hypothetical protein ISN44_As12g031630 [Arabidopsis suecica]